jgi:hypothetical protein
MHLEKDPVCGEPTPVDVACRFSWPDWVGREREMNILIVLDYIDSLTVWKGSCALMGTFRGCQVLP